METGLFVGVKYLHLLSMIVLMALLSIEHLMIKKTLDRPTLKKIQVIDTIYGVSAILVLTTALLLIFAVGKDKAFYLSNPIILHSKFTLFFIVGALSIYPTISIRRWLKSEQTSVEVPKKIVILIRAQLLLLVFMPLMGTLLANGIKP